MAQPATVFGMPLKLIMEIQQSHLRLAIPLFVLKCIQFLIPKHVTEEGIFRKSGSSTSIEKFKSEMSPFRTHNETFFEECTDPNDVTGLLKAFFREMPTPFIT